MSKTYKGRQILMETLAAEGLTHLFGNPGTTELPLIDSLNDYPQFTYILALAEGASVGMADAYARSSGTVGFVNLHVGPGLGNGIGHIYNAWEGRTPMVITAGQQDTRMRLREPMLGHDLVAMAAPVTKWSVQAETADELPHVLNRAFKVARDAPSGPVFVSLPINTLEGDTRNPPMIPARIFRKPDPDPAGVEVAAELLKAAVNPVIVCGDGVSMANANAELVALAEFTGADVFNEILVSFANFPTGHAAYRDRVTGDHGTIRRMLGGADLVLLVGGEFFEEVWHEDVYPFPEDAPLIQIDAAPHSLARNYSVTVGLTADPKPALARLLEKLRATTGADYQQAAETRRQAQVGKKQEEIARQQARIEDNWDAMPMSPARLMAELKQVLPPNAVVAHEAITSSADITRTIHFEKPTDYMGTWSGGIGQGLPMGIGAKLAHPDRPVICLSGDGSAMYTIQALWTAAHHRIPVVFIILSNRTYRILKLNMNIYRSRFGLGGERSYPHMDLNDPELGFVQMAQGMGVPGKLVEKPEDFAAAFKEALASGGPYLLDCVVEGKV